MLFDDYFALLICIILKVSTMQLSTVIFSSNENSHECGKEIGIGVLHILC